MAIQPSPFGQIGGPLDQADQVAPDASPQGVAGRSSQVNKLGSFVMGAQSRIMAEIQASAPNRLYTAGGECNFDRALLSSGGLAPVTGRVFLAGFIAQRTEAVSQIAMVSAGVAMAAGATLVKMAVYQFDANGNATLVASTNSDLTLFAATFTYYQRALTVPFTKQRGVNYATAVLVVSSAAIATLSTAAGANSGGTGYAGTMSRRPPVTSVSTNYTVADLPATIPNANFVAGQSHIADLLP